MYLTFVIIFYLILLFPFFVQDRPQIKFFLIPIILLTLLQIFLAIPAVISSTYNLISMHMLGIILFCVIPAITEETTKFLLIKKYTHKYISFYIAWLIIIYEYHLFFGGNLLQNSSANLFQVKFHFSSIMMRAPSFVLHTFTCIMIHQSIKGNYYMKITLILMMLLHALFNFFIIRSFAYAPIP